MRRLERILVDASSVDHARLDLIALLRFTPVRDVEAPVEGTLDLGCPFSKSGSLNSSMWEDATLV